jgi:hypothetical protein
MVYRVHSDGTYTPVQTIEIWHSVVTGTQASLIG